MRARSWNTTRYSMPLTSTKRRSPTASLAMPSKRQPGFAGRPLNPLLGLVNDGNKATIATYPERHRSAARRKDRVVAADAGAVTRAELRPTLAHEDHPGLHVLAGENLHAEHLRVRVATVARRAESFLVCHLLLLLRLERGLERREGALPLRVRALVVER